MSIGHTCGHREVQGVQYSLVPSGVTREKYVLVHLLRCSIVFEPLFKQIFHSLFPCYLFVAGKHTGEAGQATGDNETTVITTNLRQIVDEIHVQQRISTVGDRQTGDQSLVA